MALATFDEVLARVSPSVVKTGGTATPAGGTDDLLTTGSAVKLSPRVDFVRLENHNSSFTKRKGIAAARQWDIASEFYLQGSGALGTAAVNGFASIDALFRASAMSVAASAGTSLTYTRDAITSLEQCVIWAENEGALLKAQRCIVNVVIDSVPTDGSKVTITGVGTYAEPTRASISGFTGGTFRGEAFLDAQGTVTPSSGGSAYTPAIQSVRFDNGVQTGRILDANDATGVLKFITRDARPTLRLAVAEDTDSNAGVLFEKWFNMMTTNTVCQVKYRMGQTAGTIPTMTVPQAQITQKSSSEGDGYMIATYDMDITHTTNESDFSLVIT